MIWIRIQMQQIREIVVFVCFRRWWYKYKQWIFMNGCAFLHNDPIVFTIRRKLRKLCWWFLMLLGVERMPLKIIEKDSSERFIDTPIDSNPPIDIAERKLVWLFSRSQLLYFQSEKSSHHVAVTGSLSLPSITTCRVNPYLMFRVCGCWLLQLVRNADKFAVSVTIK